MGIKDVWKREGGELSVPLPPGTMEVREELELLGGANGLRPLGLEMGGTRGRVSVTFLAVGIMGRRGAAGFWMPIPR